MIPRATLALMLGAATGLLLAGAQLFTAPGAVSLGGAGQDLMARVNGRPVLRSDFVTQLQTLSGKPLNATGAEERRQVLQDMVREELFVQRGLEMDFAATDAEVRAALVRAVEQQVTAESQFARPTEQTLRQFHADHRDSFTSAGTIALQAFERPVPPDGPTRQQVLHRASAVIAGAAPAKGLLADGWQPMTSLPSTPDLYVAQESRLGSRLFDEARLLTDGSFTQPIVDGSRLVVLQVLQHRPPRAQAFEAVQAEVLRAWSRSAAAERLKDTEAFLRGRADIRYGAAATQLEAAP